MTLGKLLIWKSGEKNTREIGKLLGYPKTAIDDFVKNDDYDDEERTKRMKRNHYYTHSAKYEERELLYHL